MHEVEQEGGLKETVLEAQLLESKPSEELLVIIAMLMRLYDVNMKLLAHFDIDAAKELWNAHADGSDFNPALFVPEMVQRDTDEPSS